MKILLLIQRFQLRGAEMFAAQMGSHFLSQGHDVMLVSLFKGDGVLPFPGQKVCLEASHSRFSDFKGWRKLAGIVRQFRPDVVQANSGDTLKFAVFSRDVFGWRNPLVFRNASMISLYLRSPLQRLFNGFLYAHVSRVASVSSGTRKDFERLFPRMSKKIETIPIGIETGQTVDANALFKNDKVNVIHVGGFTFEKNHQGLMLIMNRLRKERSDIILWLVGDGPLRARVEEQVRELGLEEQVRFLGFRNDVLSLVKGARLLVLPSKIEGLPAVILEAFWCETPVVAYAVGGIPEVLTPETGWPVPLGDEAGFVKAVQEVMATPDAARVSAARELVRTQYDNRVLSGRFLELYAGIAR